MENLYSSSNKIVSARVLLLKELLPQKGTHPADVTLRQGHEQPKQGTASSKETPLPVGPARSGAAPPKAGRRSKKKLYQENKRC